MSQETIPEDKISEFVKRIREADGRNIEAIILFGSAVSGDFHPGLSDVNLFCVLRDASFDALERLAPVAKWWSKQNQPSPLWMGRHELERSTDVFTIELLDMKQHHRVLFGEDLLSGLHISTHLHRIQVEYELREKLLLLRRQMFSAAGDFTRLLDLVMHSSPSFATLFRHALIALGDNSPHSRRDAIHALAKRLQFDDSAFDQALDLRERKIDRKKLDVQCLCGRYLSAIDKVATAVDQALDSGASAH
jgi:predicted nucleotidyltransferase